MISGINHITLAVRDTETSFDFYRNILGFKPLCRWHKGAYFLVGKLWFCLNYDEQTQVANDYTHIAFNVSNDDFDELRSKILANKVKIFKNNQSEGDSLYFLDPDGHKLEIHVGDWQTRIADKKNNLGTWRDAEFFV